MGGVREEALAGELCSRYSAAHSHCRSACRSQLGLLLRALAAVEALTWGWDIHRPSAFPVRGTD